MTLFRKKKKVEYQTDLSIYDMFHIKSIEPASITIDGTDPEVVNITVSTVDNLYMIKMKQEEKTIRKNLTEFWDKNKWVANEKNTGGGVTVISKAAFDRLINKLTYELNKNE